MSGDRSAQTTLPRHTRLLIGVLAWVVAALAVTAIPGTAGMAAMIAWADGAVFGQAHG